MDTEIQEAKRDGDIVKTLRLMKRAGKVYTDQIMELKATPDQVIEALGLEMPDLDHAITLAALYNHAKTQGMGFLSAKMTHIMGLDEACIVLMLGPTSFDYLRGRVMKTDVSRLDTILYERDNGRRSYTDALNCKGCSRCKEGE